MIYDDEDEVTEVKICVTPPHLVNQVAEQRKLHEEESFCITNVEMCDACLFLTDGNCTCG